MNTFKLTHKYDESFAYFQTTSDISDVVGCLLAEQFKAEGIQDDVHVEMHTLSSKASAYMKEFSWGANNCDPVEICIYTERERFVKYSDEIVDKYSYLD